jgi:hypothetical protein
MDEMARMFKRIHNLILFYIEACIFSSLYELKVFLEGYYSCSLEDLGIGNLATYPNTASYNTTVISKITLGHICKAVEEARKRNKTKITEERVLKILSKQTGVSVDQLGVIVREQKLGIFIAESNRIRKDLENHWTSVLKEKVKSGFIPGSRVYKKLESKVKRDIELEIQATLKTKAADHAFFAFEQLKAKKKKSAVTFCSRCGVIMTLVR